MQNIETLVKGGPHFAQDHVTYLALNARTIFCFGNKKRKFLDSSARIAKTTVLIHSIEYKEKLGTTYASWCSAFFNLFPKQS